MITQESASARKTVFFGANDSSDSGAADSKPRNARIVNTEPESPPDGPVKCGLFARRVQNTDSVLWCAGLISVMASATKTSSSKVPITAPTLVEARMPNQPIEKMKASQNTA